jgi:hypothetical protein
MLGYHYAIESESEHQITFVRVLTDAEAISPTILMGNRYSEDPKKHVQFTLIEADGSTRVDVSGAVTVKMALGKENRADLSNNSAFGRDVSDEFQRLRNAAKKAAVTAPEPKSLEAMLVSADKPAEAAPSADSHTDTAPESSPIKGLATVYVYRLGQFYAKLLKPSVYCDGRQIGRVQNGHFIRATFEPGKHEFRSNDKDSGVEIDLKPDTVYYLRVDMTTGDAWKSHGRIMEMMPDQGRYEVEKLSPQ